MEGYLYLYRYKDIVCSIDIFETIEVHKRTATELASCSEHQEI